MPTKTKTKIRVTLITFFQMDDYKNVNRWLATLDSRKAVQRGLRVNGFGPDALSERHSKDDFSDDEY